MIDLVPIVLAVVVFILYCDLCFVYGDLGLIIVVMVLVVLSVVLW